MSLKERRKDKINKLVKMFLTYRNKTYRNYSGPSIYFHIKAMKMYNKCKNKRNFMRLLKNDAYLETLYATLASWGMQRMGSKGMVGFNDFKKSINSVRKNLSSLFGSKSNLRNMKDAEKLILIKIFRKLKIMNSKSIIVSNSKLLHHLLPKLVPPIDREHILKLFCKSLPTNEIIEKESDVFIEVIDEYKKLYSKIPSWKMRKRNVFDTSKIKIIDNAILGS